MIWEDIIFIRIFREIWVFDVLEMNALNPD